MNHRHHYLIVFKLLKSVGVAVLLVLILCVFPKSVKWYP